MARNVLRRVTTALLASALLAGTLSCGGDDGGGGGNDTEGRLFQPSGVVGPDSFAPTFELTAYRVPDVAEPSGGKVAGNAPGLYAGRTYGGSGKNICDVEAMIRFLTYYEDRGRAWAAVQGVTYEELPAYLRSLTPVYALQNLNVKMFGFKNGKSYGYDAVIAAGTAILIDAKGMPRARCACGNPLLGPSEEQPKSIEPRQPGDSSPDGTTLEGEETLPPESGDNPPSDGGEPQPQCPEPTDSGWTDYVTKDGDVWRWIPSLDGWIDLTEPVSSVVATSDLPGLAEECDPPDDEGWEPDPLCPSEGETTEYRDVWSGDLWTYDPARAGWTNATTGDFVAQLSDVPSYASTCGEPSTENVPCPPYYPPLGTLWTASDGTTFSYYLDPSLGPVWDDLSTAEPETISASDLQSTYGCGGSYVPQYPQCPPNHPLTGATWQDATGTWWVYGPNSGGPAGWDDQSTTEIEALSTESLPDLPIGVDCGGDRHRYDLCPPIVANDGDRFVDSTTGATWVYSNLLGGWTREGSTDGVVIVYTSLLPGYFEQCMPPCPPAQMSSIDTGVWVDPSDGSLWIWDGTALVWVSSLDPTVTVASSTDLPAYDSFCLRPCPPESSGSSVPSYVRDENGNPTPNPEAAATFGTRDDSAVTVEPSDAGATIEPITDEYVRPSTSAYDDCNPSGCVAEGSEPPIGWRWVDSNGVTWTYSGNGIYTSSRGDVVSSVENVPGYRTTCYQPPTTTEALPCPPEAKSDPYVDQNGIDWYWVGPNGVDPSTSDHGRWWYHLYSDGSRAYKATVELDPWLADCPPPDDPSIQIAPGELSVGLSAPTQICAGDKIVVRIFVTPSPGAAVNDVGVTVNDESIQLNENGPNTWSGGDETTEPGTYTVVGGASDTSGSTGSSTTTVVVVACEKPVDSVAPTETTEGPNRAPSIRLVLKVDCVELPSESPTEVQVLVRVSDPDGDELSVVVTAESSAGSPGGETYTVADGSDSRRVNLSLTYSYRGTTIVVEGTVSDGELEDSDSIEFRGANPGGCSTASTTTSTSYAPPTAAPSTIDPNDKMPTLSTYDSPAMPACLNSTGFTTVRFRVVDPEGKTVGLQARIDGAIAVGGTSPTSGPSGQVFTVNLRAADAGRTLSVTGTDYANVTTPYSAKITTTIC